MKENIQVLPGFIDGHVHPREPGREDKETYARVSVAAAAGGVTTFGDMPNNSRIVEGRSVDHSTNSPQRMREKVETATGHTMVDIFPYGRLDQHSRSILPYFLNLGVPLKYYCELTTNQDHQLTDTEIVETLEDVAKAKEDTHTDPLVVVHSEDDTLPIVLETGYKRDLRIQIAHLATKFQAEQALKYKRLGMRLTTEVTPHHLKFSYLDKECLGPMGVMKPNLGQEEDPDALMFYLRQRINSQIGYVIDTVGSDHAPHTDEENQNGAFGVPGIETVARIILTMVADKQLDGERAVDLLYYTPQRIFGLKKQPQTHIEVDLNKRTEVGREGYFSKCQTNPFEGLELVPILKTVYKGELIYNGECVLGQPKGQMLIDLSKL